MIRNNITTLPEKIGTLPTGERVSFNRAFEHHASEGYSDLTFTTLTLDSESTPEPSTQQVLHITKEFVLEEAKSLGFDYLHLYSDYKENPFDPGRDRNLIVRMGP